MYQIQKIALGTPYIQRTHDRLVWLLARPSQTFRKTIAQL